MASSRVVLKLSVDAKVPPTGVHRHCIGLAMGTNMAPVWATLILRMYEHSAGLDHCISLSQFIDDGDKQLSTCFAIHQIVQSYGGR